DSDKYSFSNANLSSYIFLLLGVKFLKAVGLFLTYDLLKLVNIVHLLFFLKLCTGLFQVVMHKPLSSGVLSRTRFSRVLARGLLGCLTDGLWLLGLSLCGPLRCILLYEHEDLLVLSAVRSLCCKSTTTVATSSAGASSASLPARRGGAFFVGAVLALLFLDHDSAAAAVGDQAGPAGVLGLADHKLGLIIVLCAALLTSLKPPAVSADDKSIAALSTCSSATMLLPVSLWQAAFSETADAADTASSHVLAALAFVVFIVFALDRSVSAACSAQIGSASLNRVAFLLVSSSGLLLSLVWSRPTGRLSSIVPPSEHRLSGGCLAAFLLMQACALVFSASGAQRPSARNASFIGYSAGGLPLYTSGGGSAALLSRARHDAMRLARDGLRQVLAEPNSRSIFYFLLLNLAFTGVELAYGLWTNSLGLLSDGFHMLFDCSALVMGLCASVLGRWSPTRSFPFGFNRVEVLSGFVNAMFLMIIAAFVLISALSRLLHPPAISSERLLPVSICGLLVNLFGLFSFSHAHSHGGGSATKSKPHHPDSASTCSSDAKSHSHSHSHSHTHSHSHAHNDANMRGVFLHVMADTLGSVGVIISSFLVSWFGFYIADPVCSLFISLLILLSVMPLLKDTVSVLALSSPMPEAEDALQRLLAISGVMRCRNCRFWRHTNDTLCACVHLVVATDAGEQRILTAATAALKTSGFHTTAVQIEKEAFFQHMSGMGNTVPSDLEVTRDSLMVQVCTV
ncbi:hypothetical protein BOX15_Mlig008285g1, partial [Macrostomum lignano]